MERPVIDKWANFLYNEKLVPERMDAESIMQLVKLSEEASKIRGPKISMHKHKLESREFLCNLAMDLGIDLLAIKHRITGKRLIGRGLLDAWNLAYQKKYGSVIGTSGRAEDIRRKVVTKLSKEMKEPI